MTTKEQQCPNPSTKRKLKYLRRGSIVAIFIAIIPFMFYIIDIFPDGDIWENSFFTYQSKYYESVNVFIWVLIGKLIPLSLFIIWFFTCKNWWYHVILIPIALYAFQLISIIVEDSQLITDKEVYYLIPTTIIILSIVYTVRTKVFDKIHNIDLSELDTLKKTRKKSWWNRLR
ncbi:hypothetical protein [Aquimarina litoralis]|uniref:hypothetical protein n=1 Tax=Aquimarina litoralis TaxID=584605 RepID=UPI001C572D3A|nr:hypothetical protein [Aquimarina litoralis]MBW1298724.1 hypothetical protein [Aquimarina litoralis]